jgi:DNA-binding beta-propeller fold protein YncE
MFQSIGERMRVTIALLVLAIALLLALTATSALAAPPASFGSEGPGAGQISEGAKGIAIDQETGDVYLADTNNNRVDEFGAEGEFIRAWGWGVADGTAELQTCTATCFKGIAGSGTGQFTEPEGIAVDNSAGASHHDVYVADKNHNRIEKFTPSGEFLLAFAASFSSGHAIAVDNAGTVYIADPGAVHEFDEAGAPSAEVAVPVAGDIRALAVDSVGDLYLIGENGEGGVRKFDPTGVELGAPRGPAGGFGGGLYFASITIGPADELILYAIQEGRVDTFAPGGAPSGVFSEPSGAASIAFGDTVERLYGLGNGEVTLLAMPPGPYLLPGSQVATAIGTTSATLNATLNPEGGEETKYHFEYGTEAGVYPESTPVTLLPVNEVQSLTLLAEGGTFSLSFEGEPSPEVPFNASAAEIQAALEAIAAIGAGNVAVTGPAAGPFSIEFTGALAATDVAELSPEPANLTGAKPSATVATTSPGHSAFEDREASAALTNLQPRTIYHFRLVATNKAGETTEGPDQTFETLPPVSIDSTSVSQVTATSARLEAELNPHGLPTTYHFEYVTQRHFETDGFSEPFRTADASAGSGTVDLTRTAQLQGLAPATTYRYRVVATNSLGTVEGERSQSGEEIAHTLTTQGPAGPPLPDGRGWEMVSPPQKNGAPLEAMAEDGPDIQAAADGSGLTYGVKGSIDAQAPGNRAPSYSQLLSRRGPAGWSTRDVTVPSETVVGFHPGHLSEYQLFSADLSLAAVDPFGATPLSPLTTERTPYLRQPGGSFTPLVIGCPEVPQPCPPAIQEHANVPPGTKFGGTPAPEIGTLGAVEFLDATPDLSHVVLDSPQALTEDFETGFVSHVELINVYEWTAGALTLLSQIPSTPAAVCGGSGPACLPAAEAGLISNLGGDFKGLSRHALSSDGSRAVFLATDSNGTRHLFLRDVGRGETLQLDALQGGEGGGSGAHFAFQDASADGSRVFFTDGARLTPGSNANVSEPDLYMCQIALDGAGHLSCALTDLSVDHNPGEHANVRGLVVGSAADGSAVYFAAAGALTAVPNPEGAVAVNGQPNLYRYDAETGETRLVAVLSGTDTPDWGEIGIGGVRTLPGLTARLSPDGRWLAFMSERPLTGYDNRDAKTGARDEEVFLYDSQAQGGAGKLLCASCNPTGARPEGVLVTSDPGPLVARPLIWLHQTLAANIPGWTPFQEGGALYQSRYLSDSGRLFFNANDALAPTDSNGTEDVYQYEPPGVGGCTTSSPTHGAKSEGCVDLISSGTSAEESAFLDASQSGNDVFFLTAAQLSPADRDTALDAYDAHVCSAEVPCPPPPAPAEPECNGDACQGLVQAPNDPTPGSLTFQGPGNLTPGLAPSVKKKTVKCVKPKKLRHNKCVKPKSKKKKKKAKKARKATTSDRGAKS